MLDVESWGGHIRGDQSAALNAAWRAVGEFVGSTTRVLGYGNIADLDDLWPHRPPGLRLVVAAYGHNPRCSGKLAHQYTDGSGHGGGLPEGAAPFGTCDMNSADGVDTCPIRPRVRNFDPGGARRRPAPGRVVS